MEYNQNQIESDAQIWDWELLVDDCRPQFQNPSSQFQNPNSQIQPLDVDNDGCDNNNSSSFSDGNIIRCDYFSIESNGNETGPDVETDKSGSETGSWLDPDQVQLGGGDVIRGHSGGAAHLSAGSGSPASPLSDDGLGSGNYQNAPDNGVTEGHGSGELGFPQNYQNAIVEVTHEGEVGNDQNAPSSVTNEGGENGELGPQNYQNALVSGINEGDRNDELGPQDYQNAIVEGTHEGEVRNDQTTLGSIINEGVENGELRSRQNDQNAIVEETHEGEVGNEQTALGGETDEGGENSELGFPQNCQNASEEVTNGREVVNDQTTLGGETNERGENGRLVESGAHNGEGKSGGWWKVPLELLRYCVLRVRPIWSFSIAAAAIMGFVLLRRVWLGKIKRKGYNKGLSLNVTVDDKKVSQFMTRAARLNEVFSVVRRVPIIRPSLPTPGLAPWSVIGMR